MNSGNLLSYREIVRIGRRGFESDLLGFARETVTRTATHRFWHSSRHLMALDRPEAKSMRSLPNRAEQSNRLSVANESDIDMWLIACAGWVRDEIAQDCLHLDVVRPFCQLTDLSNQNRELGLVERRISIGVDESKATRTWMISNEQFCARDVRPRFAIRFLILVLNLN
jgi:hypothetical protein